MSRSRKKNPCMTICGGSNKKSKQMANKLFRRTNKLRIKQGKDTKLMRELTDVWEFSTDGLAYYKENIDDKYMRK